MKILVCIDDTDNLESRGTGELASMLAGDVEVNGWGACSFVTRHQLLVHPDVPYTSHNSSMCFAADIKEESLDALISHAGRFLELESAEGSDPGLCVAVLDRIGGEDELIGYGRKAKQKVIAQHEAYELAQRLNIHLSAHGGTGHGVIGALAGAGLRLSGNDGRMKGGLRIGGVNSVCRVGDICAHREVDAVRSLDGKALEGDELVVMGDKAKTVLLDGKSILLVVPSECEIPAAPWRTCPRQLLKSY